VAATKLVAAAALARKESRGAHFRTDYPQTESTGRRTLLTLSDADQIVRSLDADSGNVASTAH